MSRTNALGLLLLILGAILADLGLGLIDGRLALVGVGVEAFVVGLVMAVSDA